jgi:hypothetical protein
MARPARWRWPRRCPVRSASIRWPGRRSTILAFRPSLIGMMPVMGGMMTWGPDLPNTMSSSAPPRDRTQSAGGHSCSAAAAVRVLTVRLPLPCQVRPNAVNNQRVGCSPQCGLRVRDKTGPGALGDDGSPSRPRRPLGGDRATPAARAAEAEGRQGQRGLPDPEQFVQRPVRHGGGLLRHMPRRASCSRSTRTTSSRDRTPGGCYEPCAGASNPLGAGWHPGRRSCSRAKHLAPGPRQPRGG